MEWCEGYMENIENSEPSFGTIVFMLKITAIFSFLVSVDKQQQDKKTYHKLHLKSQSLGLNTESPEGCVNLDKHLLTINVGLLFDDQTLLQQRLLEPTTVHLQL